MTDEDTDAELTKDDVFEILSSSRRRFTLYELCREGDRMDLDVLARRLAAHEEDIPPEAVESDAEKRMYISLYQTHLPRLASSGLVVYNREERTVALTDRIEELVAFLRTDSPATRAWARWYVTLAVVGIVIVTVTFVVPGLATGLTGLLVVDLLLVCAVAVVQWRFETRNAVDAEALLEAIV